LHVVTSCFQPRANLSLNAVQTVAGLSALTYLHLGSVYQSEASMPGCKELACLRSTSLRVLTVALNQVLLRTSHCRDRLPHALEAQLPIHDQVSGSKLRFT